MSADGGALFRAFHNRDAPLGPVNLRNRGAAGLKQAFETTGAGCHYAPMRADADGLPQVCTAVSFQVNVSTAGRYATLSAEARLGPVVVPGYLWARRLHARSVN